MEVGFVPCQRGPSPRLVPVEIDCPQTTHVLRSPNPTSRPGPFPDLDPSFFVPSTPFIDLRTRIPGGGSNLGWECLVGKTRERLKSAEWDFRSDGNRFQDHPSKYPTGTLHRESHRPRLLSHYNKVLFSRFLIPPIPEGFPKRRHSLCNHDSLSSSTSHPHPTLTRTESKRGLWCGG